MQVKSKLNRKAFPNSIISRTFLNLNWHPDPDPIIKDQNGNDGDTTPLHCAAQKGHKNVYKLLLDSGANPDIKDARGQSAKHYATVYDVQQKLMKEEAMKNGVKKALCCMKNDS